MSNDQGGTPPIWQEAARRVRDRQSHEVSTEETIIRRICTQFNLPTRVTVSGSRRRDSQESTLAWFCHHYATFPYIMGYRKVPWQHRALKDLRSRFTKTPCYRALVEVEDTRTDDRPALCIFRWPTLGGCVIYRATSIATPTTTGFSIVTSVRNVNGRVRVFVVEPFRDRKSVV